jgi:hypothetical protein
MISAAGIKDQELTIIVSMMLIELALLRLSRAAFFKHLALLDSKGSSYWSRSAWCESAAAHQAALRARHPSYT